jgi:hypothetical protein
MKNNPLFYLALILAAVFILVRCNTQNQTTAKAEASTEKAAETNADANKLDSTAASHKTAKADDEQQAIPEPEDIKTNYYDLPDTYKEKISDAMAVNPDNKLTERSIDIIKNYLDVYLLKKNNLPGQGITSNYFWYIYNTLPGFVSKNERHQGYYAGENKQNFEKQLQAYGIYRIDRSSENLKRIFEFAKPVLKEFLTPEKYRSLNVNTKVNQLLKIYQMMQEKADYKQLLTEAYIHADTATGTWVQYGEEPVFEPYSLAYGQDAYILSEIICKYFKYDRHHPYYGHPDLSFWMRRVHEGNEETVFELLQNIQNLYK